MITMNSCIPFPYINLWSLLYIQGSHCETEVEKIKYITCPRDVCKPPSRCVALIRGGFRCELCLGSKLDESECIDCAILSNNYNRFCELRVRSFTQGSFLMFPPLKQRHSFNIKLRLITFHFFYCKCI